METLKLQLPDITGNEIIVREGEAQKPLPLREPLVINISGDIHSVAEFIRNRDNGHSSQQIDRNKAIVTVDKDARTIKLELDPENHYGATVLAKLQESTELSQFCINKNKRYNRKELLDLIRFNRLFFEDKNEHASVIAGLFKLRIKSQTEIEQEKDNQGNKRSLHDVKTVDDGGMVKMFSLTIPLFKGFNPEKITVEICFEVVNGDVSFWLESIGLKEATDAAIDEIFETQLAACDGFVIINK